MEPVKKEINTGGIMQIVIIGRLRSGKSLISLCLARRLAKEFQTSFDASHVTYEAADFLKLLNDEKKMKRGSVAILDEAGITASSRRWYSDLNQAISATTQTFGNRGFIIIYTVPHLKFVDSAILRLINVCIKTKDKPSREKHEAYGKWYWWEVNPETGKIKKRFPYWYEGINKKTLKLTRFTLPPQDFIDEYVKQTATYKKKVMKQAEATAHSEAEQERHKARKVDLNAIKKKVFANPGRYLQQWGTRTILRRPLAAHDFGLSLSQSERLRDTVRAEVIKKGLDRQQIKIGGTGGSQ